MATVDRILDDLPEPVRQMVRQIWDALPSDKQKDLHRVFHALPSSLKPLKDIFFSVLDQYKPVFGTKRTIAIVGPANVGKSTLYNQLIPRKEDRAQVGPVPGTTRDNQVADTGLFSSWIHPAPTRWALWANGNGRSLSRQPRPPTFW